MEYVYTLVRLDEPIPVVFETYDLALAHVKRRHRKEIEREIESGGMLTLTEVDVPEEKMGTSSNLFINEGAVNYFLTKVPVVKQKKRRQSRRSH